MWIVLSTAGHWRNQIVAGIGGIGGELSKRQGVLFLPMVALHFKEEREITALLPKWDISMIFNHLLDVNLKRCFISFSFILRGCFCQ